MRMSCNGCRVLRKGCSANCSIRPCLEWIKGPQSQANATAFLAKFYGRAGLMNLINAGSEHLRPAIFQSLLYEACGRILNPVYGSVGLLWAGNWQLCQNAVQAVLTGASFTSDNATQTNDGPPLKAYDIRHVSKDENSGSGANGLHRVRTRCRFKRSGAGKPETGKVCAGSGDDDSGRSTSHGSSLSHQSEAAAPKVDGESRENDSLVSSATASTRAELEADLNSGAEANGCGNGEIELDLTLGFEPVSQAHAHGSKSKVDNQLETHDSFSDDDGVCKMELSLHF